MTVKSVGSRRNRRRRAARFGPEGPAGSACRLRLPVERLRIRETPLGDLTVDSPSGYCVD